MHHLVSIYADKRKKEEQLFSFHPYRHHRIETSLQKQINDNTKQPRFHVFECPPPIFIVTYFTHLLRQIFGKAILHLLTQNSFKTCYNIYR